MTQTVPGPLFAVRLIRGSRRQLGKRLITNDFDVCLFVTDGVVLVDADYIKDRKVFGHVLAAFRYGREDLDVLGLTFRKDLYLASAQIFPLDSNSKRSPTRLQVSLTRKAPLN